MQQAHQKSNKVMLVLCVHMTLPTSLGDMGGGYMLRVLTETYV